MTTYLGSTSFSGLKPSKKIRLHAPKLYSQALFFPAPYLRTFKSPLIGASLMKISANSARSPLQIEQM